MTLRREKSSRRPAPAKKMDHTEEALRTSESLLNGIIDQSPYPIWISDETGTLIRINPACLELLQIKEEEVLGKYNIFQDNIVEEQGFMPLVKSVFEKGETVHFEIKYDSSRLKHLRLDKNASVFLEVTVFPIRDAYGKIKHAAIQHMDITKRKIAEEQVQTALREKEALLRELYHRTKNNMQVINSMISLQMNRIQDERIKTMMLEVENKIRAMALVHQKLYQSKNLSEINLKEYISDLVILIIGSFYMLSDRIKIRTIMEDISIPVDIAIPCGLVLNELISNSLKHAFPGDRQGEIVILLHRLQDGKIELKVSDNGVGVPAGYDSEPGGKMGLKTVTAIVESQLMGEVNSVSDNGFTCTITFKENIHETRF